MTRPRTGKAQKRLGAALLITGGVLTLVFRLIPASEMDDALFAASFAPILLLLGGAFCYWRGRQYAARMSATTIITDSKPDVLYLRAFRSDPSTAKNILSVMLTSGLISGLATEEEQLAEALLPFGDLVAVGRPGERLPTPGAARMYASDDEWKNLVKQQMRTARLVVIRAGAGEGLIWELKEASMILSPQGLLILFLHMKKKHYESFRSMANSVFGASLPEAKTIRALGGISGFMSFSADWTPRFLRLHAPFFRRSAYKPYRRLFKFALKPVFEESGIKWESPPVSVLLATMAAIGGLIAALILFVVIAAVLNG